MSKYENDEADDDAASIHSYGNQFDDDDDDDDTGLATACAPAPLSESTIKAKSAIVARTYVGSSAAKESKQEEMPVSRTEPAKPLAAEIPVKSALNRKGYNQRGFREACVTLQMQATLRELAANELKMAVDDRVESCAKLQLDKDVKIFAESGNVQGNVTLVEVHTTFPFVVALQANQKLMGTEHASFYTNSGVKAQYVAMPQAKGAIEPVTLLHANMEKADLRVAEKFKEYLKPGSMEKYVMRTLKEGIQIVAVDSPLFRLMQCMREVEKRPLMEVSQSEELAGQKTFPAEEIEPTLKKWNEFIETYNNVDLNNALSFTLVPASAQQRVSSDKAPKSAWLSSKGFVKSRAKTGDVLKNGKELPDAELDVMRVFTAKLVVEYLPIEEAAEFLAEMKEKEQAEAELAEVKKKQGTRA